MPPKSIEESKPSIFYLPDKRGELQPVLGFGYQEFVDLYNLKNQLQRRDEPPKYSLQKFDAAGTAGQQYAELTILFEILLRDDDWIRIPLRLGEGLLRGAVAYKGDGSQFLHYEPDGDGYVCWLRGKADSRHEVTLSLLVPLVSAGDQTRLKLFVPRATGSQLKLSVPLSKAIGQISEGATLVSTKETTGGATEFRAVGLGGEVQFAWQNADVPTVEAPLVFEASAIVRTKLGSRSITADATLQVRSYGSAFDHFTVRLPPGAELTPGTSSAYVVTPIDAGTNRKEHQRAVVVRLQKKTAGPVEVRLACRRDYDSLTAKSWCELAGFEVVGAVRQWGTMVVSAGSQWQTLWGPSNDVRVTEPLPDPLHSEDDVAAFEYSAQPYSLTVRLAPRKTRVRVYPEYVLLVERDEMQLEGRLSYAISGPKLATLDLAIPGWELDEIGPDEIVSSDAVIVAGSDITVPLTQPTSGTVELRLRAHRRIEAGAKSLSVAMPQLKCDVAMPMSLAVVAADNVELSPDAKGTEGLVQEQAARSSNVPRRQQAAVYYRGTRGTALFASGFQSRRLTADKLADGADRELTWQADGTRDAAIVDRAWVQTWLTSQERQDRAVFQLTTKLKELEVILPSEAQIDAYSVLVNGNRVDGRTVDDHRILIPLVAQTDSRPYLIELQYHVAGRPPRGAMAIELPQIAKAWSRRMYWQLVVPTNEHLIGNPAGFVSEFHWGWHRYFWGRQPTLDQSGLEAWVGATSRTAIPERENVYLFSTLGSLRMAEIQTAGRSWIVLWASGAALVAGLLLIYVPAGRHPATLLGVSVALVAAGLLAPEPTLLFAQAASLGLAMTLVAGLLKRRLMGGRRRSVVRTESPSRRLEPGSTRLPAAQPLGAALTESMPAVVPHGPGNGEQ